MNSLKDNNNNNNNTKIWLHKWGVPICHACLWMLGLLFTTDFWGVVHRFFPGEYDQYVISLGAVVVVFFGEIILTFIDCAIEKETLLLSMTFCKFIALLITTIVAVVVFMFLGCHFLSNADMQCWGKYLIGVVILISSYTKGMEIWLQNNWDEYIAYNPTSPKLNFSI